MLARLPKVRMAALLGLLSFITIYHFSSFELVLRLVFILTFTITLEFLLWKTRGVQPFMPSASIVTALIIFLLFDNISPFYFSIIPISLAIVQKQLLRIGNAHIFNPAVFGLYAASLVGLPTFWWGVSWGWEPLLLIILGASFVSLVTIKQQYIIFPYIASSIVIYALLLGIIPDLKDLAGAFLAGSYWFFTLIMLPEPATSPQKRLNKIFYAVLVATLPVVLSWQKAFIIPGDTILLSLLLGNLLAYLGHRQLLKPNNIIPRKTPAAVSI